MFYEIFRTSFIKVLEMTMSTRFILLRHFEQV